MPSDDLFERTYAAKHREIVMLAHRHSQHVPDMDPDDVAMEMEIVLWKASRTWDETTGVPLMAYWWTAWRNRRRDLIDRYYAAKRPKSKPRSLAWMPDVGYLERRLPRPRNLTPLGAFIWNALADGYTGAEIRQAGEISKRGYYDVIHGWQTEYVHGLLIDAEQNTL